MRVEERMSERERERERERETDTKAEYFICAETEEVQLLDKTNRRRSDRLKRVDGKNFPQKEKAVHSEILEDQKVAAEKLDELVEVRRSFLANLYLRVFPIEVLPLSEEDEGAEGQISIYGNGSHSELL